MTIFKSRGEMGRPPDDVDRRLELSCQGTTEDETQQKQTETTEESSSAPPFPPLPSVQNLGRSPRLRMTFLDPVVFAPPRVAR
jgi:hypothetical protein